MLRRISFQDKNLRQKGFTLVELLVVIVILGVLAAVVVFAVGGITNTSKQNACKIEVRTVNSALQAVELLRGAQGQGLTVVTAEEVVVDADVPEVPVGIDGETVMMPTPVRCTIRPKALRVRVPRNRPGVPPPKPAVDWSTLAHLASFRS